MVLRLHQHNIGYTADGVSITVINDICNDIDNYTR